MYLLAAARNKKVIQGIGSVLHRSARAWDRQASALAREYSPPFTRVPTHMAASDTSISGPIGKLRLSATFACPVLQHPFRIAVVPCVPTGAAEEVPLGLELSGMANEAVTRPEAANGEERAMHTATMSQPLEAAGFQAAMAGALARDDEGDVPLLAEDPPGDGERKRQLEPSAQEEGGPSKKPAYYYEFAKKSWETQETFRLPDGTYWPEVGEGVSAQQCVCRPARWVL